MEAGYRVHLTHAGALPRFGGLKYTNDSSDARHLAQLLRLGILPRGYIYYSRRPSRGSVCEAEHSEGQIEARFALWRARQQRMLVELLAILTHDQQASIR